MKKLSFPTTDYDFHKYFKLEGFGDRVFSLMFDGPRIVVDQPDYDADAVAHMDALMPLAKGEWVMIEGKEYVTVIGDDERPAEFLLAASMPTIVMDGHGRLLVNGHILKSQGKPLLAKAGETESGFNFRLSYALRTAQLEGHIPEHCTYVLNGGGGLERISTL